MPTSDLNMWQSRQTERFTEWANSLRESSPRTSSRIMAMIFSTLLSKTQHHGEMSTDRSKIDRPGCARNPCPNKTSAEYHVRGTSGPGRITYCGKTESGTKFNFRSCEGANRPSPGTTLGGGPISKVRLFTTGDKKLSTGT